MKYKVGDRVAVYQGTSRKTAVIKQIDATNLVVEFDDKNATEHMGRFPHPNQCRKLKPKQKPVAREFWIMYGNRLVPEIFTSEESAKTQSRKYDGSFIMRVREVLQNPTSNEVGG